MPIRIPAVAWSWPVGVGCEPAPRPRVSTPMLDDGPWGGVPIGGMGAGSIGRTQRGDFARRHLRIGEHRFEPGGVDGFAVWAHDGERTHAVLLRTTDGPEGWGPALPPGSGTYRALFPRGWFEFDIAGLPVRIVEEQLTPIVPGDDATSTLPLGAFELELTNPGDRAIDVAVLLAWRDELGAVLGPTDAGPAPSTRAADGAATVVATRPGASFALAADGGAGATATAATFDPAAPGELWQDFATDGRLGGSAGAGPAGAGTAVAARVALPPGGSKTLRFAIAWDLPFASFGGGRAWPKRYTREWGTAGASAGRLARTALERIDDWRAAVERWQAPYLDAPGRPDWYRAALMNELYFLVDGATFWPASAPEEDTIGLIECFDYPFYDTLDVHFYASFALARLWPRLEASISRAYAATVTVDDPATVTIEASGEVAPRKVRGALPHDLGGPGEDPLVRVNHYRFQEVNTWKDLNAKFVLQAWRDRELAPEPATFVRAVYPAVCAAMDHLARFDRDGDGLPEHDGRPDQTYDTWPMSGPSAYGGSLWLASLRGAAAFARAVGDETRAAEWDAVFERGRAAFESKLWNGRSFDYDAGGGISSDSVMADQLAGQWYADVAGLGPIVPDERVRSALQRVFELNVLGFEGGRMGAVNGMRPDGTIDASSEQSQEVWIGTTYALAAFMIGRGLVEEGWATAEGAARVTWERGFWFRTPEAFDRDGNFRASIYLRPLAIWAIEEALDRARAVR